MLSKSEAKCFGGQVMELFATVYPPAEAKDTLKGFIDARFVHGLSL